MTMFDLSGKRIWIAGHRGMVGSALMRRLEREGCTLLEVSRRECDLVRQDQVETWLQRARPDVVVVAAAKVGGGVATVPPGVVRKLADHPLTDKGLAAFLADWAKTGQKILS